MKIKTFILLHMPTEQDIPTKIIDFFDPKYDHLRTGQRRIVLPHVFVPLRDPTDNASGEEIIVDPIQTDDGMGDLNQVILPASI